jgi:membrane protease subunit (stomatin/prohibitin family)
MFMAAATQMRNDPKFMEQMRQRAEAIRAAQMAREQNVPKQKSVEQSVACPSCSAPNPQTGKFCGNCGKPLPALKKACPKCGQQSDPQIKFCGNCGTKL